MDDQQGHVIDGTARARQWRRSKPRTGLTAPDPPETWTNAPKSLAGSLLVPADMLPAAYAADERLTENQQGRAPASLPSVDADPGAPAPDEHGVHENPFLVPEANPFLVPEAAHVEHRPTSGRRLLAALLARRRGLLSARGGSSRRLRCRLPMPRWRGEVRVIRLLALGALTAAVVATVVIATRPDAAHPAFSSALGTTGSLVERGSGIAAINPFAQQTTARDRVSPRARRVRAHRTVVTQRRPRPARKPAVVLARYTPPRSDAGVSSASSATPSYAGSTPTRGTSQSAPSSAGGTTSSSSSGTSQSVARTTTSSSSGNSRPAFGENGTLGPGRGAPGTQ